MINSVDVSDPTRNLQPMNGPDYVGMVDGHMLPRRGRAWTEEGVDAMVEAMMAAGNITVGLFHAMLMNWTPTTVAYMMKFSREDRYKDKGLERDVAGIKAAVTAPYLAVVLITEE